ncbi:HAD family hydrolase [Glutamicibacter sp. X7]
MLLLVDLDNTLVDRASAFDSWATAFVESIGKSKSDVEWLIQADRDGYEPRDSLAHAIHERFELEMAVEGILDRLLYEHVDWLTMETATAQALRNASDHGWKIAIVTNGTTSQQWLKIQKVGLDSYVDDVVISEAEQVKKPNPEIFRIAARRLGSDLLGGWMVGDHATADIAGGQAAGLHTGWVSRGKEWSRETIFPTLTADTAAEVNDAIVRIRNY